ncbi:DUF6292 family protein [Amycolatopsis sp. NPDC089917]|uniref:DUF6292 family protein n=1 Tax=Amycolatopsis sp. NPDC089917 TaxID=3155187 RepID=UPI00341386B0
MESEFGGAAVRGLHNYVRIVIGELGLSGNAYYAQLDPSAGAYIALERRLPEHTGCDVALVWNELKGWALALEMDSAADLLVVQRLGADLLPAPRVVAAFTRKAYEGEVMSNRDISSPPHCEALVDRLAAYSGLPHTAIPGDDRPATTV